MSITLNFLFISYSQLTLSHVSLTIKFGQVFEYTRASGHLKGQVFRKIVNGPTGKVYKSFAAAAKDGFERSKCPSPK